MRCSQCRAYYDPKFYPVCPECEYANTEELPSTNANWTCPVIWYSLNGDRHLVEATSTDKEEAMASALYVALRLGYTVPRWYQFWRWREQRYSMEKAILWLGGRVGELKKERANVI